MDLYLAVIAGAHRERVVPLPVGKTLVLGRNIHVDLVLEHVTVNRRHGEVGRDENGAWVRDLDSRNGTFLNGRRLYPGARAPLQPGDLLQLAAVHVALVRADPAWSAWNDGAVCKIARVVRDGRAFDRLPLLADALEEAGCADAMILSHCRRGAQHEEACWVPEVLLGGP